MKRVDSKAIASIVLLALSLVLVGCSGEVTGGLQEGSTAQTGNAEDQGEAADGQSQTEGSEQSESLSDGSDAPESESDVGPTDAIATETADVAIQTDADSVDGDTDVEIPDERFFGQLITGLSTDYVYKGVWAGESGHIVAVGNDGIIVSRSPDDKWSVLSEGEGGDLLNSVSGASHDDLWVVGRDGVILHVDEGGMSSGQACADDNDCDNGDPCTVDECIDEECVATPTGGLNCCGSQLNSWTFDTGTLDDWTVTEQVGGLTWQPVSYVDNASGIPRYTSPPYALYFGDPLLTPPSYSNGVAVGATAVTPSFIMPTTGSVTLTFSLFLDVEADPGYDLFDIVVNAVGGEVPLWSKSGLAEIPTGGMVEVTVDMTPFLGQLISLGFRFTSVDGAFNETEGIYIDDVVVDSSCEASGAGASLYPTLWGVDVVAEDDVYAVGMNGTIIHYDGKSWKEASGVKAGVVWMAMHGSADSMALVGTGGNILLSQGGSLVSVKSPVTNTLHGVYTGDGQTFWAVGEGGTLVKGEGDDWTQQAIPTAVNLFAIHGSGPNDIYAAGALGKVLHYNGTSWSLLTGLPSQVVSTEFHTVFVDQQGKATISGMQGSLLQGNAADGFIHLGNLSVGGAIDGAWGDGDILLMVGENSNIYRYLGAWTPEKTTTTQHLRGVWGASADDIWVVGLAGVVLHWNGVEWTQVQAPMTGAIETVWGRASDDVYAAGEAGAIMHWNGTMWSLIVSQTDSNLRNVHGFDGGEVWAVGATGTIMRLGPLGWTQTPPPPILYDDGSAELVTTNFYGIWGETEEDLWAVGEGGVIYRWDGTTWKEFEDANFGFTLRDIYGLSAEDIWAVGSEGNIIHWDGEEWSVWPSGSVATLYAIDGDGEDHVVITGDIGTVLVLQE